LWGRVGDEFKYHLVNEKNLKKKKIEIQKLPKGEKLHSSYFFILGESIEHAC
jgi:hypothetical protein